jgi:hypothetical protein
MASSVFLLILICSLTGLLLLRLTDEQRPAGLLDADPVPLTLLVTILALLAALVIFSIRNLLLLSYT